MSDANRPVAGGSVGRVLLVCLVTVASGPWGVGAVGAVGPGPPTGTADVAVQETSLEQSTYRASAGTVVDLALSVPEGAEGTVNVGSTDVGYLATAEFADSDNSGSVTLSLNTYLAGRPEAGAPASAWTVGDGDSLTGTRLRTEPLSDPLDPAAYDVNVTVDGVEADVAVIGLEAATVTNTTTYTAPGGALDDPGTLTATDRIAVGDTLVARADAPSLLGPLEAASGDSTTERFRSLVADDDVRFGLDEVGDGESDDEAELDLGASVDAGAVEVETTADGTVTLLLDESEAVFDGGETAGGRFEMDVVLLEEAGLAEENLATDAEFTFTERAASVDTGGGSRLELPATADATVRGTTTVAPGTAVEVVVRRSGRFRRAQTVTVTENRSFAAAFDLGSVEPGTELTVQVADLGGRTQGVVVPPEAARSTTDPSGSPTVTTDQETGTGATSRTATTSEGAADDGTGPAETATAATAGQSPTTAAEGPGFGPVVVVLALAVLARRRE